MANSIQFYGKVQQWHGNSGAVVRAWAYYRRYGRELELMSEHAVLNANYLRHQIMNPNREHQNSIHSMPVDGAPTEVVKHEFTLSMMPLKELLGYRKGHCKTTTRLWLHVSNTLLPNDSTRMFDDRTNRKESREVLDKFAEDFLTILSEDPEVIQTAPHTTDVRRVDEVLAARTLGLRKEFED